MDAIRQGAFLWILTTDHGLLEDFSRFSICA